MNPKFRVWDKLRKRMSTVDRIYFDTEGVQLRDNSGLYWRDFRDIILMQSTDLKDKNSTEIFEGDVLKNNDYPNQTFICKHSMLQASFQAESLNGLLTLSLWKDEERDWQVLGNIYENPELME
ncbi:hypothetical protein C6A24_06340 [Streptococcus anginosus]|uniref:YopX family protein n=1 Tax=Streptococcus anginosus TaxID=1328 RepID=UPI000D036FF8|nr:YopX family protein [Streptococcus anginosus]PRT73580.1 hypothetical protein C6A24_06340 [Streptococcus anginosus]